MRDDIDFNSEPNFEPDSGEPAGSLRRALYLWERQSPAPQRIINSDIHEPDPVPETNPSSDAVTGLGSDAFHVPDDIDGTIERKLKRQAARLTMLERIIPGDRRLDSPRFSLMMLNAFIGRAVTDGASLARIPGLFSITERIDGELSDLELEYPAALEAAEAEPDPTPVLLRDEIRRLFADLTLQQKAQQRQVVTSLAALHTAITELRAQLPDRDRLVENFAPRHDPNDQSGLSAGRDDLARPLIDPERLVDPRPVLAAARAAASRANLELADHVSAENHPDQSHHHQRPYKSVLLGSAVLGILIFLFGRDAVQYFSPSSFNPGLAQP